MADITAQSFATVARDRPPTRVEVLVFALLMIVFGVWASQAHEGYWKLAAGFGDNADYAAISHAVRTLDLNALTGAKHFWGLSYAAALVATTFHATDLHAVIYVSLCSSVLALLLVYQLWGPWVSLYFLVIDWNWIQSTAYGGALPLFAALVFAALLAAHRGKWPLSAILGALATTVQPLGIFVLAPILVVEWRRKGRLPVLSMAFAGAILALYCIPFVVRFHNPIASYRGYQKQDWLGGWPITYPLAAIIENYRNGLNFGSLLTKYLKVGYVLAHLVALGSLAFCETIRRRALERPLELAFVILYSAFILLYNSPHWALVIHARLLVPILPFFLWAFYEWLPKRRWVVYPLGLLSLMLGCAGALNIQGAHELVIRLLDRV
jgi:hypothetical protein